MNENVDGMMSRLAGLRGKNWVDHFGPPSRTHVAPSGRSEEENREVQELKEQVAWIPQIVQDNLAITLTSFLPTLVESIANWSAGGRVGSCPIPSMVSHSNNAAPTNQANYVFVTPPASTAAPQVLVTPPAITAAPEYMLVPPCHHRGGTGAPSTRR